MGGKLVSMTEAIRRLSEEQLSMLYDVALETYQDAALAAGKVSQDAEIAVLRRMADAQRRADALQKKRRRK